MSDNLIIDVGPCRVLASGKLAANSVPAIVKVRPFNRIGPFEFKRAESAREFELTEPYDVMLRANVLAGAFGDALALTRFIALGGSPLLRVIPAGPFAYCIRISRGYGWRGLPLVSPEELEASLVLSALRRLIEIGAITRDRGRFVVELFEIMLHDAGAGRVRAFLLTALARRAVRRSVRSARGGDK